MTTFLSCPTRSLSELCMPAGTTPVSPQTNLPRIMKSYRLIDKLLQALLHLNKSSIGVCPIHPPPTTHPQQLYLAVIQLPVVRSEHVRTLFDSTQSQESKSEVSLHKRMQQCALRPILCPLLFLSSLWSNLSMWGHFLIVLNLRNPNLRSACAKERGNAHYWPFYVLCSFLAPSGPI